MVAINETQHTSYRILSKAPGRGRWKALPFTDWTSTDLERISKRLQTVREQTPGWKFRLQVQEVRTFRTDWEDV